MFAWLRKLVGWPTPATPDDKPARRDDRSGRPARPRARYDAAQTTDDNRRHWGNSDGLSARQANNLGVRRLLRNRSRYERDNNGYCGGLVLTLANDLFGTGPRLQAHLDDKGLNRTVEQAFHRWADAVGLMDKLRTAKMAKTGDGEGLAVLATEEVPDEPVRLDVIGLECDQLTTPVNAMPPNLAQWVDGIEMDARGRPLWYHILKAHPGDLFNVAILFQEYERLPARQVIHWFRKTRPGQARGVPEITPGLPLCAQMRRWTLATLTAAESAADLAVLLTSNAPPGGAEVPDEPFETLELERGLMTALPAGTDAKQMAAEHPNVQYGPFKAELLKEFGRPVSAPQNVVTGSSLEYNYSSARLDLLLYRAALLVERDGCRLTVLDPILNAWYAEARLIPGYLAADPSALPERLPHAWNWPGFQAIDPLKESLADSERLGNCTTTLQELLAENGQDWEVFLRQRARERDLMVELGLPLPAWLGAAPTPAAASAGKGALDGATGGGGDGGAAQHAPLTRRQLIDLALAEDRRTNGAYLNGGAH